MSNSQQDILRRYPDARFLSHEEFAQNIVGRNFEYRDVENGIIIHYPKEYFGDDGTYQIGGSRVNYYGTFQFIDGIVLIDCQCRFMEMGMERIIFRDRGKIFIAGRDLHHGMFEIIF